MKKLILLVFLVTTLLPAAAGAQAPGPFLSGMFTDNMVLQRGMRDPIWGWTKPGAQVRVSMDGKTATATAGTDGKWLAHLGPFRAGGPYTLTVSSVEHVWGLRRASGRHAGGIYTLPVEGPETTTISNVLVGDVWICSGQSNMQFGIANGNNADQEIANANYPEIRLFTVPMTIALAPRANLPAPRPDGASQWSVCTPDTVKTGGWGGFTAVGYFFGRDLYNALKVPIGLIHTSWGGTVAEAWTSASALNAMPDFQPAIAKVAADAAAQQPAGKNPNIVTVLYNGMIAPVIPFGMKGVIWYQGESNAQRAYQYRTLLPTMIQDWRARWGEGPFPFLIVQLANFRASNPAPGENDWAELREAQLMTAESLPKTGLAVTIDIGAANTIHPKDKQDVGMRLALAAENIAYHEKVDDSGPIYRSMKREGNRIRLSFRDVDGGLVAHGDKLQGFAIAGPDRHFVWADAVIDGDTIVVSSPQVPDPAAVRYAWAINPVCNLYNKAGLPASPFRTDQWPGLTERKR